MIVKIEKVEMIQKNHQLKLYQKKVLTCCVSFAFGFSPVFAMKSVFFNCSIDDDFFHYDQSKCIIK